jgi:sugar lactone lactonase YvrE
MNFKSFRARPFFVDSEQPQLCFSRRFALGAGALWLGQLYGCGGSTTDMPNSTTSSTPSTPVVLVNTGTVTTLARGFSYPRGIAVDTQGNVYLSDTSNNMIKKIDTTQTVSTVAGTLAAGSTDTSGGTPSFRSPYGIAVDASGNLYISDSSNHKIRKIDASGVVTTFAGSGSAGNTNGTGVAASFHYPDGLALDAHGNLYVADSGNHQIRKIDPNGVVTTLAGSGSSGRVNASGTSATFNTPSGVAVDGSGNVYVADTNNNLIRKIDTTGAVTTFAGSGTYGNANDPVALNASFKAPAGVAVDANGNVFVADQYNNGIRKIDTSGAVTTLAGLASGTYGSSDGQGSAAGFNAPFAVAVDMQGHVYVADTFNNSVRLIQ